MIHHSLFIIHSKGVTNGTKQKSKMTVVAKYQGTTVKALQQLRRDARGNGTKVKVVKNRLVIKAMQQNSSLKDTNISDLQGMLLYAFNSEDEVAPAQALKAFAKANPTIEFVGAFSADGTYMDAAQLLSPVHDITNALSGNLHALLDGLADKATA